MRRDTIARADPSGSLINVVTRVRSHDSASAAPNFTCHIPCWGFEVAKGGLDTFREKSKDAGEFTYSKMEGMVFVDRLEQALEIVDRRRAQLGISSIVNLVCDWGCLSALWHALTIFQKTNPETGIWIHRCSIHSWGNWSSDATRRCTLALSGGKMSQPRLTTAIYWESRAYHHNVATVDTAIDEVAKACRIGFISKGALDSMSDQDRAGTLHQLLKFLLNLIGVGNWGDEIGRVDKASSVRMRRLLTLSRQFYWKRGEDPKFVLYAGAASDEERARGQFKALAAAGTQLGMHMNQARWLTTIPIGISILVSRWILPSAMSELWKRCSSKDAVTGDLGLSIGGGESAKQEDIVKGEGGELKTYLSCVFATVYLSAPGDAATTSMRKREGGGRKISNSGVHQIFIDMFDHCADRFNSATIHLASLLAHAKLKPTKTDTFAIASTLRLGLCTLWGQYTVQQGGLQSVEFPRRAANLLHERLFSPGSPNVEILIANLKSLVPQTIGNIFDAAARSLIAAFEGDVNRTGSNKRYIIDAWDKQFTSLAEWGEQDAYEVSFMHLFSDLTHF